MGGHSEVSERGQSGVRAGAKFSWGTERGLCLILSCFRRFFSTLWATSIDGKPFMILALRARAAVAPAPSGASLPAVASRLRLPRSEFGRLFTEEDRPRTLAPSRPFSLSDASTSAPVLKPFFRSTTAWFLLLLSLFTSLRWRILLCSSSRVSSLLVERLLDFS